MIFEYVHTHIDDTRIPAATVVAVIFLLKVSSIAVASEEKLMAASLSASASWMYMFCTCHNGAERILKNIVKWFDIFINTNIYIYKLVYIYRLYTCIYLHTFVCSPDDTCIVQ